MWAMRQERSSDQKGSQMPPHAGVAFFIAVRRNGSISAKKRHYGSALSKVDEVIFCCK